MFERGNKTNFLFEKEKFTLKAAQCILAQCDALRGFVATALLGLVKPLAGMQM